MIALDGTYLLGLNAENGKLIAFVDRSLGERIMKRQGVAQARVQSEADAWQLCEDFLRYAELSDTPWTRGALKRLSEEEGAAHDKANRADRWVCMFEERVEGYEGRVNTCSMTLDVIEGKVEVLAASTLWKFSGNKVHLSKAEAVAKIRHLHEERREEELHRGNTDLARRFEWPGDEEARTNMKLVVHAGGSVIGRDGKSAAMRREANLCWQLTTEYGETYLNTESGDPIEIELWTSARGSTSPKLPAGAKQIKGLPGRTNYVLPDGREFYQTSDGSYVEVGPPDRSRKTTPEPTAALLGLLGVAAAGAVAIGVRQWIARSRWVGRHK